MITEKTEWCIRCDQCGYEAIVDNPHDYMANPEQDGRWYDSPVRLICRGCIIDRACRIFGHVPDPYGANWCSRCRVIAS